MIIQNLGAILESLDNTDELEADRRKLSGELDIVAGMLEEGGEADHLAELSARYGQMDDRIRQVQKELALKKHRIHEINEYIRSLEFLNSVEFREELWCSMVQKVTVTGRILSFNMADGSVMEEKIS